MSKFSDEYDVPKIKRFAIGFVILLICLYFFHGSKFQTEFAAAHPPPVNMVCGGDSISFDNWLK